MKFITLLIGVIFHSFLSFSGAIAQQTIAVSGGNLTESTGSVSYSIGQVVFSVHKGEGGTVAEGVQQPFEISIITSADEEDLVNLTFSVFPNPTNNQLNLRIAGGAFEGFQYELFDLSGHLLKSDILRGNEANILMAQYKTGIYVLRVIHRNQELKIYKIIKN